MALGGNENVYPRAGERPGLQLEVSFNVKGLSSWSASDMRDFRTTG